MLCLIICTQIHTQAHTDLYLQSLEWIHPSWFNWNHTAISNHHRDETSELQNRPLTWSAPPLAKGPKSGSSSLSHLPSLLSSFTLFKGLDRNNVAYRLLFSVSMSTDIAQSMTSGSLRFELQEQSLTQETGSCFGVLLCGPVPFFPSLWR